MVRLIVTSFEKLMVVALWLLFIGAGIAGYLWNGPVGALTALAVSFVFSVLFIAPVMIFSDIRRTLVSIEQKLDRATVANTADRPTAPALSAVSQTRSQAPRVSLSRDPAPASTAPEIETEPAEIAPDREPPRMVLRAQK